MEVVQGIWHNKDAIIQFGKDHKDEAIKAGKFAKEKYDGMCACMCMYVYVCICILHFTFLSV